MLRLLRHLVFWFSIAFLVGIARDARAGDPAAAQALFDEGKKLMGEKKYAEACSKFEESQKLDPGLGTQKNLAFCYASMGRTATAWSLYLDVASQAKAAGPSQAKREKEARDAAAELEPKLSKLTIVVDSPADGIEVKRGNEVVGQGAWGTPIPVDPGQIKLTAVAPKRKLWEKTITIDKPGETKVEIPELEKGEPPAGYYPAPTNTATGPAQNYYQGNGNPPPNYFPPGPPPMKRRSSGLFGGGIACIVVGSITTVAGLAWLAVDAAGNSLGGDNSLAPAGGTTVVGVLLLGGGIAMTVIGGKKVPVEGPKAEKKDAAALLLSPEVRLGLGNAQLKWEF
jgi:hypothetical protein